MGGGGGGAVVGGGGGGYVVFFLPTVPRVDGDVQGLEVNRVVVFGGYKSLSDDLSG